MRALAQQVAGLAQKTSIPGSGAAAATKPSVWSKEPKEEQEKINYHEKGLKECCKVEEDGGAAQKATTQKLTKCKQQLDRYKNDPNSLQEKLESITGKIQNK
ncbi:unnamed protein product [Prorocentrum cordatum]|uniref:Tubulin-specific chaperone A n=1 Tax=Prorocentrum cordatum TaxID=2364126 RepID=A0ABN9UK04_9DINO|nr:unnamed protein product [Polarella glacialis]